MFATLARAFRPLDTTAVDAAIAEARCEHQAVRVRARALRMSINCDDVSGTVNRMRVKVADSAGHVLRQIFSEPITEPVPPPMLRLLDKLGGRYDHRMDGPG